MRALKMQRLSCSALALVTSLALLPTPAGATAVEGHVRMEVSLSFAPESWLDASSSTPQTAYQDYWRDPEGAAWTDGELWSYLDPGLYVMGFENLALASVHPESGPKQAFAFQQWDLAPAVLASVTNVGTVAQDVDFKLDFSVSRALASTGPGTHSQLYSAYSIRGDGPEGQLFSHGRAGWLDTFGNERIHDSDDWTKVFVVRLQPGQSFTLALGPTDSLVDLQASAIPEPQTWVLMLSGFGLAGAGLRRGYCPRAERT